MDICMSEKLEYERVPCKYAHVENDPLTAHDLEVFIIHNTDWLSTMAKEIVYTEKGYPSFVEQSKAFSTKDNPHVYAKDAKFFSVISWECTCLCARESTFELQAVGKDPSDPSRFDIAGKIVLCFYGDGEKDKIYCCYSFDVNVGNVKKTLKFKRMSKTYSAIEFDEGSAFILKPNSFSLDISNNSTCPHDLQGIANEIVKREKIEWRRWSVTNWSFHDFVVRSDSYDVSGRFAIFADGVVNPQGIVYDYECTVPKFTLTVDLDKLQYKKFCSLNDRQLAKRYVDDSSFPNRNSEGSEFDDVERPSHYVSENGKECIDWIEDMLTPEEFRGYLKGCALKYQWRYKHKGQPKKDISKAVQYLTMLKDKIDYPRGE